MNPIKNLLYKRELAYWSQRPPAEQWEELLTGKAPMLRRGRQFFKHIPSDPRCKLCNAPFQGAGAPLMRLIGKAPSQLNPNFCNTCMETAPIGGAEIELTLLFADIRGSTALAEKMSAMEFSRLINNFFSVATRLLIQSDSFIGRLAGDQVIGLYLPAFAGSNHAAVAIESAQALLRATGHDHPDGPWAPLGVGIHLGQAFVGKVGQEGITDFTVLGDAANVAARLSATARAGEVLISEPAMVAAQLPTAGIEARTLELKGRSEALKVWSLHSASST